MWLSPAAFLVDGLQHNRMPPDWMYAHEKRQRELQWKRERVAVAADKDRVRIEYTAARKAAFEVYLRSPDGQRLFEQAYTALLPLHQRTEPHNPLGAAQAAARAYVDEHHFEFPSLALWSLGRESPVNGDA